MPHTIIQLVGGPLDGIEVPSDGYFKEGDIEAVNTLEYVKPGAEWSAESVYRMTKGKLVYDPEGTKERNRLTAVVLDTSNSKQNMDKEKANPRAERRLE